MLMTCSLGVLLTASGLWEGPVCEPDDNGEKQEVNEKKPRPWSHSVQPTQQVDWV